MEFTFDSVSQFDSFSENAENFIRVEILIKIEIVLVHSLNKRCYDITLFL